MYASLGLNELSRSRYPPIHSPNRFFIYGWASSQPIIKNITYVTFSVNGGDLAYGELRYPPIHSPKWFVPMVISKLSFVYWRFKSLKLRHIPALFTRMWSFFSVAWKSSTNLRTVSRSDKSNWKWKLKLWFSHLSNNFNLIDYKTQRNSWLLHIIFSFCVLQRFCSIAPDKSWLANWHQRFCRQYA